MLKRIFLGLLVLIAVVVLYSGFKSGDYFIKREIVINRPANEVFPYLVSMKKADEWMPWKDVDPNVQSTYSGPDEGVGSVSSWESTGQMGTGKAEVIKVIPNEIVTTKISYSKPMVMEQISEFILRPQGDSTQVAWTVKGYNNFLFRLIGTVTCMNPDDYVGGQFAKGLTNLKSMVETK